MPFTKKLFITVLVLSVSLAGSLFAQPTYNDFLMTNLDATYVGHPVLFGDPLVPADDGWLIHIVCAGDDMTPDLPYLGYTNPLKGLPSGDDFLADPVQNNINSWVIESLGPGYEGCFFPTTNCRALATGTGTEPLVNIGDVVYLRAFDAATVDDALWYSDMDGTFEVYYNNGAPYTVWDVRFQDPVPLPVELLSFTATPGNNLVTLEWVTASEKDNSHFVVYRDNEKLIDIPTQAVGGESSEPLTYNYKDSQVTNGLEYTYQLTAMDINGVETDVLQEVEVVPSWNSSYVVTAYNLHQNYPNPFNPGTTIEYDVLESGKVYLTIYNIKGQEVVKLVDGENRVGPLQHVAFWDAQGLSSGIYFYEVRVNDFKMTKKMILVQ